MRRVLQLLAFAVVLYFGLTVALPWVRGRVEGISEDKIVGREERGTEGPGGCLDSTEKTQRFLDREIRTLSSPADPEAWGDSYYEMGVMVDDAERSCTCANQVCDLAQQALQEMSAMITGIDRAVRGDADFANLVPRHQAKIDEFVQQAQVVYDRQLGI